MVFDHTPNHWEHTTLGNIAVENGRGLVDGPFGSNLPASEYISNGVPVVRGSNLSRGESRFIDNEFVYVSEETAKRLERSTCIPGDIIFTKKGTLGQTGIIPFGHRYKRFLLSSNQMKLTVNQGKADPYFVYYYVSTKEATEKIIRDSSVTGVPKTNVAYLRTFPISLPPVETQRKIAAILSAYDDLIENNTRRIRLLEQAAHDLYREWFVHFRFPGHENVEFVDGLPVGWEMVGASLAIEINPRISLDKETEKPFISMDRLSTESMLIDLTDLEYRNGSNGSKFQNFDTLFARITPCLENGKTGYVQFLPPNGTGIGSTEFVVMRSRTLTPEMVYCLARYPEFRSAAQKTMTGASGRQRIQNSFFDNYYIPQPDTECLNRFSSLIAPMFEEIRILAEKNANLRETRDLLLPRLVSGEVDVEGLEMQAL